MYGSLGKPWARRLTVSRSSTKRETRGQHPPGPPQWPVDIIFQNDVSCKCFVDVQTTYLKVSRIKIHSLGSVFLFHIFSRGNNFFGLTSLGLHTVNAVVYTVHCDQFLVRTSFGNHAVDKQNDFIAVDDRRKAVGYGY